MAAEKANFSVSGMARLLEIVEIEDYITGLAREAAGPSPAQRRRSELTAKILDFHDESDGTYGSPRILADLREAGEQISAKTVAKLMRVAGIAGSAHAGSCR